MSTTLDLVSRLARVALPRASRRRDAAGALIFAVGLYGLRRMIRRGHVRAYPAHTECGPGVSIVDTAPGMPRLDIHLCTDPANPFDGDEPFEDADQLLEQIREALFGEEPRGWTMGPEGEA